MVSETNNKRILTSDSPADFALNAKIKVMTAIINAHKQSGNKQTETANILGISQPKFSNIVNYKTEKFSLENLIWLSAKIGVKISLKINDENVNF